MNKEQIKKLFTTGIMAPTRLSEDYIKTFTDTVTNHLSEERIVLRGGSLSLEEKNKRLLRVNNISNKLEEIINLYSEDPNYPGLQIQMMDLLKNIESPEDLIQAELDTPVTQETIQKDLFTASRAGKIDLIQKALDQGAEINGLDYKGYSAAHYAASLQKDEALKFLAERGANLHLVDPKGNNLLHYYVGTTKSNPNVPMLEYLVGKDLNVNQVNDKRPGYNGETPLAHMFTRDAFYFHEEPDPYKEKSNELELEYYIPVVNLLLSAGATADEYDLYHAIKFGYFECARIIIDRCNIPVETAIPYAENYAGKVAYKMKLASFTGEEVALSPDEVNMVKINEYYGEAASLFNLGGIGYHIYDIVTGKMLDSATELEDLDALLVCAESAPVSDVVVAYASVEENAPINLEWPVANTVGHQRSDQGYELGFSHGVAAEYIFVKPSFSYLSDSITGKNSEKTVVDYFIKDNISIESIASMLINAATFTATIYTGVSPANAAIATKLMSDLAFNPSEVNLLSSNYAASVLGYVMKSIIHSSVIHQTQVHNHPNKFVAGVLTPATSTALQLGYDLAEHAYQQMMGESSEVAE